MGLFSLLFGKRKNTDSTDVDIKEAVKVSFSDGAMNIDWDADKLKQLAVQGERNRKEQIKNFRYDSRLVQGKVFQLLETIYILGSSKNLDLVKRRCQDHL